jgi:exosome complex component RRP41
MKTASGDRRLVEINNCIKSAFEAAILLYLYPRSEISIYVVILADDGGKLPACINATSLALVDAGIAMKDMVVACGAGYANDAPLIDLNRQEESSFEGGKEGVYLPVAIMPQRNTVVMAKCDSRLPLATFNEVLDAAIEGCKAMFDLMQGFVREHVNSKTLARDGQASILVS